MLKVTLALAFLSGGALAYCRNACQLRPIVTWRSAGDHATPSPRLQCPCSCHHRAATKQPHWRWCYDTVGWCSLAPCRNCLQLRLGATLASTGVSCTWLSLCPVSSALAAAPEGATKQHYTGDGGRCAFAARAISFICLYQRPVYTTGRCRCCDFSFQCQRDLRFRFLEIGN